MPKEERFLVSGKSDISHLGSSDLESRGDTNRATHTGTRRFGRISKAGGQGEAIGRMVAEIGKFDREFQWIR